MVVRISNLPDALKPGVYDIKYVRTAGDIMLFEYVPNIELREPDGSHLILRPKDLNV